MVTHRLLHEVKKKRWFNLDVIFNRVTYDIGKVSTGR